MHGSSESWVFLCQFQRVGFFSMKQRRSSKDRRWPVRLLVELGGLLLVASAAGAATFTNTTPINIPVGGPAMPYPSSIAVSLATGVVTNVSVMLNNLSHGYLDDLDVLLVGPG